MSEKTRVTCRSGLEGEQSRLRSRYETYHEFETFALQYDLHKRLGYGTPPDAWDWDPVVQSSTNPEDFCRVEGGIRKYYDPKTGALADEWPVYNGEMIPTQGVMGAELVDQSPESDAKLTISLRSVRGVLEIRLPGFGGGDPTTPLVPIEIELYEGKPRLVVWPKQQPGTPGCQTIDFERRS